MAPTATDSKTQVQDHLAHGLTVRQIAALLGVSTQAVYRTIKRHDLGLPDRRAS